MGLIRLNHAWPRQKKTRSASDKKSPTPQRSKKQRLTRLSSPSSSDESRSSSDAESPTSSSTTSSRFHLSTSSSTDERESKGKHDKCRYARTLHAEIRAPKVYGNKYGRHHSKRKRHHRSRTTLSSSSSSEDDITYHKSSRHAYGRLPAIHSITATKNQSKQIHRGDYVDFNALVAHAGSSLTPNTKSSPGLRIYSLPKWFHAWNQFLLANAVYHADAVSTLLIYQARI